MFYGYLAKTSASLAILLLGYGNADAMHEEAVPGSSLIQLPVQLGAVTQALREDGAESGDVAATKSSPMSGAAEGADSPACSGLSRGPGAEKKILDHGMGAAQAATLLHAERIVRETQRQVSPSMECAKGSICDLQSSTGASLTKSPDAVPSVVKWRDSLLLRDFVMALFGAFTTLLVYLRRRPDLVLKSGSKSRAKTPTSAKLLDVEDLNSQDEWGCTLLHKAAAAGATDMVSELLTRGAFVDAREAWEETPLHLAAQAGHEGICKLLLDHGADVDAVNSDDKATLLLAANAGHEAVVQLLLDRGATTGGGIDDSELPPVLLAALTRRMLLPLAA